jgi:hypothetical protein
MMAMAASDQIQEVKIWYACIPYTRAYLARLKRDPVYGHAAAGDVDAADAVADELGNLFAFEKWPWKNTTSEVVNEVHNICSGGDADARVRGF